MKFSCDQCQAQYMIADEKVGPKGVKVRCKKCGHIISVTKDSASADTGGSAPAPEANAAGPGSAFDDIFGNAAPGASGDETRAPTKVFTTSELERVRAEQSLAKSGGDTGPSQDEPPTAQMSIGPKQEWYLAIHDEQIGPITLEEVQARWDKGEVQLATLGWRAGQADWLPVSQIAELASVVSRPQATQSKAAAVAEAAAKPVEVEKPKETVTWRPSGASALADLAKEATVEAPKPAPTPEPSSPIPDFNPAPAADPFGGFNNQGPSTVWQFPTSTPKKSSGNGKLVAIVAAAVIAVMGVGGGVLYALGILPPKSQIAANPNLPGTGAQPVAPVPTPVPTPPPASQPVVAQNPTPPVAQPAPTATPPVAAKEPKGKKGSKPAKTGDDTPDAPDEPAAKPEPKAKPGKADPLDDLLGGGKKEVKATLGRDDVLGVVKTNIGGIQKCASSYSGGGGKLPPKLILKWVIKPSGFTEGHELANPELKGTQVESCVVAALKKWRFPEYREGSIPVTYPVAVSQ